LPKDSTAALSNAFIGFMVDLLASYRDYIVISPGSAGRVIMQIFIDLDA
jgi:hypothetical protein